MINIEANHPIGIFDSGIGGLTVAKSITQVLPNENIVYFGDTAHLPYGDKSVDAIKHYSVKITDFLLKQNAKIIVIACNTASSVAYHTIKDFIGRDMVVINVIDPIVQYVSNHFSNSKVGVIGTKGTINSRIYARKIKNNNNNINVTQLATPLLAPMIEEGFFNNYISRTIIHSYLSKKSFQDIDALILGCTHYPLIKKEINDFYQGKVIIIDSAEIVAQHVKEILSAIPISTEVTSRTAPIGQTGSYHFYVSDYTEAFKKSTKYFFKEEIHLEKVQIWE